MTNEPSIPADSTPLSKTEFAFPGPLRDKLVAAVLDGSKTTTTGLVAQYEHERRLLPEVGERSVVIDSAGRPVAVIEVTGVRVVPFAQVDDAHARGEGVGFTGAAEWRAEHEEFFQSEGMRRALDDPAFTVDDTTLVILQRFRAVPSAVPSA